MGWGLFRRICRRGSDRMSCARRHPRSCALCTTAESLSRLSQLLLFAEPTFSGSGFNL